MYATYAPEKYRFQKAINIPKTRHTIIAPRTEVQHIINLASHSLPKSTREVILGFLFG